jgi:hypothetical protein
MHPIQFVSRSALRAVDLHFEPTVPAQRQCGNDSGSRRAVQQNVTAQAQSARVQEHAGRPGTTETERTMQSIQTVSAQRNLLSEGETPPEATAGERKWFDAALERGRKSRFTEIVRVTPGLAAAMLALNIKNRPINESQVQKNILRLKEGRFILTHQGLAFAKTGVLNDGQHRLTAVARTGIAAEMQVTFGAEREEFEAVDTGGIRTAADMAAIANEANAKQRAAVAGLLLYMKTPGASRPDQQSTHRYAMELRGPDMDAAILTGRRLAGTCAPTAIAVAYWTIKTASRKPEMLDSFFEHLNDGANLSNPKLKLREWMKDKTQQRGLQNVQRAAVIINAWNAWVSRKKTFATEWNHQKSLPTAS